MLISLPQSQFQYLILVKSSLLPENLFAPAIIAATVITGVEITDFMSSQSLKLLLENQFTNFCRTFFLKNGILFQHTKCFIESILNTTSISYSISEYYSLG